MNINTLFLDNKRGVNDSDEFESDPARKIEQAVYELGNKVQRRHEFVEQCTNALYINIIFSLFISHT